ncbi:MAG: PKD domain-containing protein [Thermoplasmata archaeon]|nr:PKD domain-containing protein [Thermoplasmata archaeon]
MLPRLRGARGWELPVTLLVLVGMVLGSFTGLTAPAPASPAPAPTPRAPSSPAVVGPPAPLDAPRLTVAPTGPGSAVDAAQNFHLASVNLPGPHPTAWGKAGMPPGWIVPASPLQKGPQPASGPTGPGDPGIQFYSSLLGSGGNVTWNVTLPVDRNATANQSDLYDAVWFGMTVTAPSAWMDQCFLELQLYPDASWFGSGHRNGNWIGAVVAWQIQATTGAEDPCFYEPLYANGIPGSNFLNMSQGDRVSVTMTGWPANPAGELLTVHDTTNGNQSYATAFNASGSFPLNPAYSTNDYPNALAWGSGGDYPIVFGVVTGKAGNPSVPSNNSYGGCSPGLPPSTASNPAVPCPSYNPGSWVNDTLHPWQIDPPTFFNATSRSGPPAQVAFSQAFGGINTVSTLAGAACAGRLGSAYCSYPWFSYSCALGAFEFGAVDFPGVSEGFGQYHQYSQVRVANAADLAFYAPKAFSVPTCAGPSYAAAVGPGTTGGTVEFLSRSYASPASTSGLAPGEYGVEARPQPGAYFAGWTATGGIVPTLLHGAWTTVVVSGNGSLSATFSTSGPPLLVATTFHDSPNGEVAVAPGWLDSPGANTTTVPANGVLALNPGIYSILAYPPQGFVFSGWSTSGLGQIIAAPSLPFTWLIVTDLQGTASVSAAYSASVHFDRVGLAAFDPANSTYYGGTVSLGGFLTTTSRAASGWIAVGTYNLSAKPAPGYLFGGWYYTWSSIMMNFSARTNITLENGTLNSTTSAGIVLAVFIPIAVSVTFSSAPSAGGVVVTGLGYVASGRSLLLTPGLNYTISAAPDGGERFVSWSTTDSTAIWNRASGSWTEQLVINRTGGVLVLYSTGGLTTLSFQVTPVGAGLINFNGRNSYANGSTNSSVVGGEIYLAGAAASSGFTFSGWSAMGSVTVPAATTANSTVVVSGLGTLIVSFVPTTYPVTFLVNLPVPAVMHLDLSTVTVESTALLSPGVHTVSVTPPAGSTFDRWQSTGGLNLTTPGSNATTVNISGAGTLTALITPFTVAVSSVSPSVVDVGILVTFSSAPSNPGTYTVHWRGLPPGCPVTTTVVVVCPPSTVGRYNLSISYVDLWGESATSVAGTLRVNPLPAIASTNLSLTTVDVGVATNFSSVERGGTGPFTWTYAGLPGGCATANQAYLICSPSATGAFLLTVSVTDAFGKTAGGAVSLEVHSLPSLQVSVSATSLPLGSPVTISAAVSGGTGPIAYTFSGLPPGCPSSTAVFFSCTPTKAGTYHVNVTATDLFGKRASQSVTFIITQSNPSVPGVSAAELGLGLGALLVIPLVAFLTLRRRPPKPTIVATPKPRPSPVASIPTPPPSFPEWSEGPAQPQEWHEGD